MEKDKPQTGSGIEYRRADDFSAQYANNVFYETSLWDMKLIFGQLDQKLGSNVVVQHGSITIPWPQVKMMLYFIQANLSSHEARNGRVILQPGLISPVPEKVPPAFANNPKEVKAHAALREIQQAFFADNPEAVPESEKGNED
jgi:hypothetical protein